MLITKLKIPSISTAQKQDKAFNIIKITLGALFFILVIPMHVWAQTAQQCAENLINLAQKTEHSTEEITLLKDSLRTKPHLYTADVLKGFSVYQESFSSEPWKQLLPEGNVVSLLGNVEESIRAEELTKVLEAIRGRPDFAGLSDQDTAKSILREELEKILDISSPRSQISERIDSFLKAPSKISLKRALGEKNLDEVAQLLHGGDFKNPSPESLMGRYLAESNASKVLRGFPSDVAEDSAVGAEKLAVMISGTNGNDILFKKYFDQPEFLYHYHTPGQGTLYFMHHGKQGSYAAYKSVMDIARPRDGSLFPMIVLSSKEAERARLYFTLGSSSQNHAKIPWNYPNYCAKGGYTSCTHWWGEMPLGEGLVDEYRFPGNADSHAGNALSSDPQETLLQAFDLEDSANKNPIPAAINANALVFKDAAQLQPEQVKDRMSTLIKSVWKAPGHMQLWQMLGVRDSLDAGELANPGWVLRVLTGKTQSDRVPVVFVFRNDGLSELLPNFPTQASPY